MPDASYEAVIGLEVHVQLATRTKMFCRCPNLFGAEPNTLICPVCLGYPGTLPVVNKEAIDLGVRLALALGATVHEHSLFARKNYFYADLPKGYQISQFDQPLATAGELPLVQPGRVIRIHRLHLEEDAGKLLHESSGGRSLPGTSLVDFNRCGVPLVEIVSEPDLRSPSEAQEYLQSLHQVLLFTQTSDGNMEEGSMRCDANVSIRRPGETSLNTKAEIKNLNSFRFVARALEYEIARQIQVVEAGGRVRAETRTFDSQNGVTSPLRSKEGAHDYRYFPEPDLPALVLEPGRLQQIGVHLPELPWQRRTRFEQTYGLSTADALVLTSSRELADYFEAALAVHTTNPKSIANWVMTEILRELKERKVEVAQAVAPERLAHLVTLVDAGQLSSNAGKRVLAEMWASHEAPEAIAERLGLIQVRDEDQLRRWVDEAIAAHPTEVATYRGGKPQLLGFFVGRVMQMSEGSADPKAVQGLLREALSKNAGPE
ncbi:MAG: Asp-tRNA(Asn)/Glu-tRNA(Gln) amidotransferase subunit GatB [Thermoanaerobaculia bacterium]|nr:Asp-tRNA(Asn)/Glu-tRNA(Gln) amidotransferase subunit GatB [Thermoanaerobaculia bacterium]